MILCHMNRQRWLTDTKSQALQYLVLSEQGGLLKKNKSIMIHFRFTTKFLIRFISLNISFPITFPPPMITSSISSLYVYSAGIARLVTITIPRKKTASEFLQQTVYINHLRYTSHTAPPSPSGTITPEMIKTNKVCHIIGKE